VELLLIDNGYVNDVTRKEPLSPSINYSLILKQQYNQDEASQAPQASPLQPGVVSS
jgi:hypothetical protein